MLAPPAAARAASATAPPRRVMNSRRLMGIDPKAQDHGLSIAGVRPEQWRASQQKATLMSELGHERRIGTPARRAACPLWSESDRLPSSCKSVAKCHVW